jgi:hypothetical protein
LEKDKTTQGDAWWNNNGTNNNKYDQLASYFLILIFLNSSMRSLDLPIKYSSFVVNF